MELAAAPSPPLTGSWPPSRFCRPFATRAKTGPIKPAQPFSGWRVDRTPVSTARRASPVAQNGGDGEGAGHGRYNRPIGEISVFSDRSDIRSGHLFTRGRPDRGD